MYLTVCGPVAVTAGGFSFRELPSFTECDLQATTVLLSISLPTSAQGVYVDQIYDIGRIEDVHFNPW